jgi:hypothetical protein
MSRRATAGLCSAVCGFALGLTAPGLASADPQTTGPDRFFVVNVNIGFNSPISGYHPESFFKRLAETGPGALVYKPDVVTAQEVPESNNPGDPDWHDTAGFVAKLEQYVGGQWGARHSTTKGAAVFFRSDRFEEQGVDRWAELTGDNCAGESEGANEIAVKLTPKVNKNISAMYVASVHFEVGASRGCIVQNLQRANRQIENHPGWGTRPLTVIGGDFNEVPEKKDADQGQEGGHPAPNFWRREDQPSCWWKDFFGAGNGCGIDFGGNYFDTVRLKNWSEAEPGDICSEWTHGNSDRNSNDAADRCDSPKGRIDYIWARWEGSDGNPQTPDGRVEGSSADRGYWDEPNNADTGPASGADVHAHRYSDHRAVRTVFSF